MDRHPDGEDGDDDAALLAALEADGAELLDRLGIAPVQRPCGHCGHEVPDGRRRYCSDRCGANARQLEYLARHPERGGR